MQHYSNVVMYPWLFRLLNYHISRLFSTHIGYVTGVDPGWVCHPQHSLKNGERVELAHEKGKKIVHVRDT